MLAAAERTFCTAGTRRPIRMAMIAITTSSSISVKPGRTARRGMGGRMATPSESENEQEVRTNCGGYSAEQADVKRESWEFLVPARSVGTRQTRGEAWEQGEPDAPRVTASSPSAA